MTNEEHRLLLIEERLSFGPLRLDAEVVRLAGLVIDNDIHSQPWLQAILR